MFMKSLNNVLMRIVAVFAASGLGVIGAGSIAGISVVKAVTVAGLTAVAAVIEKLARAFMDFVESPKASLYLRRSGFGVIS